jgi:hypothetical protein
MLRMVGCIVARTGAQRKRCEMVNQAYYLAELASARDAVGASTRP